MSEVRKIAHNTLIQIIGKTLVISFSLLGFGLMARYLGQEGVGYYSTIYAFLAIFGILIDLGMQMTTTKIISDPKEDESKILSNALTIRLIGSVIFLGLAPIIAIFFPYPTIVKTGMLISIVGFVSASLTSTLISLFQKHLLMLRVAIAEISAKIIYLGLILSTVYFDFGFYGILFAASMDSLLTFVILIYFASKEIKLKPTFDFDIWKKILSLTWPIGLTITLNLIYFKGDIFIMSLIRSQSEVGLYGAPYRILEVLINIIYLFLGLIMPLMATAVAIKNIEKLKIIIQSVFDFLLIITIPMIVGGYFLGEKIMIIVAGPEFIISGKIIKILLIATGTIFIAALFGYAVVALNKQKKAIPFYAINAVISTIGYLIFIPKYGYWGAAWMTVFSEIFILISAAYVLKKSINFLPGLKMLPKIIVASLVMSLPLYLFNQISLFVLLPAGVVIYFISLYLIKGIDKNIILEIIKKENN